MKLGFVTVNLQRFNAKFKYMNIRISENLLKYSK